MAFNEESHRYTVTDRGVRVYPVSITTVLGVINKPPLIQWAVNQAIDYIQAELASGGEFGEDELNRILDAARFAHKLRKQEAAEIGTQAHNWLEEYWRRKFKGEAELSLPEDEKVRNCVEAGKKWIAEHKIEPLLIEKPVYSRRLQIAGRLDKLARVDGKLAVIDWKSSTGLWPEYRFQTAAYNGFLEEEMPEYVVEERWLVKLGKYDGEFRAVSIPRVELAQDLEAFESAVKLYRRLQELNRR